MYLVDCKMLFVFFLNKIADFLSLEYYNCKLFNVEKQ